jgi:uncharacterized protein (DUF427 family)
VVTRPVPGPGQESVWDYPRPPRVEREPRRIRIDFAGETIVESSRALRVLETSHPPNIYVPFADVRDGVLAESSRNTVCEWKGVATYWDLAVGEQRSSAVAWSYPGPSRGFERLAGYVSFYPAPMDGCYLGDERVTPQPGGFYGGWITSDVVGPFKGGAGTWGW